MWCSSNVPTCSIWYLFICNIFVLFEVCELEIRSVYFDSSGILFVCYASETYELVQFSHLWNSICSGLLSKKIAFPYCLALRSFEQGSVNLPTRKDVCLRTERRADFPNKKCSALESCLRFNSVSKQFLHLSRDCTSSVRERRARCCKRSLQSMTAAKWLYPDENWKASMIAFVLYEVFMISWGQRRTVQKELGFFWASTSGRRSPWMLHRVSRMSWRNANGITSYYDHLKIQQYCCSTYFRLEQL